MTSGETSQMPSEGNLAFSFKKALVCRLPLLNLVLLVRKHIFLKMVTEETTKIEF